MTDPRDGLIWKRCAEGSEFNGARCSDTGLYINWFEAMKVAKNSNFLSKTDWRLPTKTEMQAVNGRSGCEKNDNTYAFSASNMITHVVENGYAGNFWSSTPYPSEPGYVWIVYFGTGNLDRNVRDLKSHVRLVRPSHSSGTKVRQEFDRENARIVEYERSVVRLRDAARSQANLSQGSRQQSQICDAQKKTCFASCPAWRSNGNNDSHFSCNRNCESISCN